VIAYESVNKQQVFELVKRYALIRSADIVVAGLPREYQPQQSEFVRNYEIIVIDVAVIEG
jgi:hypothetical protein